MSTILFELGTEELPPKNLKTLRDALNDHVTQSLTDANIRFDTIKSFAAPRSSGINVVDMAQLAPPTVMLTIALMWVGAAPNSTGGGIKTTTFAVAVLNIVSLARGYSRIEVFRREIADISVKRAFAIICLSVIIIAFGCTLIRWAEPNMSMTEVLFESVSAYTTTGLSLGITPHLSAFSKSVLIGLMFCGRVGALTILIALLNRPRHQSYRYPSEEIIIT